MLDITLPEDTIIALASGRGNAGVAVLRVSGTRSISIIRQIFTPAAPARSFQSAKSAPPTSHIPNRLTYGTILDADSTPIDDCMVVIMPAPHSFTGEDVAEIQCHGSPAVINRLIERCIQCGARAAQPGEYSRRAFLNGKMDLAQAEALTDLISSQSEAARRMALRQLRGGLSKKLHEFNSLLLDAAAEIEAHIDFPDEDIPDLAQDRILSRITTAIAGMEQLLAGHDKARVKRDGARVILAGEPNAGKSSLFNAIVGRERAIVSPHPGTTRDTIEATVDIGGLAITLVDTAGIREGAGEIEQIGIDRTHEEIREADIVLHLLDGSGVTNPNLSQWPALDVSPHTNILKVLTKQDNAPAQISGAGNQDAGSSPADMIAVSSTTGAGIPDLETAICRQLIGTDTEESDAEMSRVRHAEHLRRAVASAHMARQAFQAGESGDLVMVDLRDALSSIGEILGERLDEQILDRIFSTFCLGK